MEKDWEIFRSQNYFRFKYHPDRTIGEWFEVMILRRWCIGHEEKKHNSAAALRFLFRSKATFFYFLFTYHPDLSSDNSIYSLVGGFNHLEKYESQIGSSSQHIMENIMFQATNQYMICIINYSHISPWYPHGWLNPNHFSLYIYNHGTFWKFTMFKKVVNHRTNWVSGPFCKLCVWSQRLPYRVYR